MTMHDKSDPVREWLFVEDLLAQEELERLEKMTDAEVIAEMEAEGLDPIVPSEEEILARLPVPRAASSSPRLGERAPVVAQAVPESLPSPIAAARVTRLRPRSLRLVWLVAAALGAGVLILGTLGGRAIVAWFHSAPRSTPDDRYPPAATSKELAAKLRHDAEGNCAQDDWGECERLLDQARDLDPGGETDPQVQAERAAIAKSKEPAPPPRFDPRHFSDKPRLDGR
jgi:hypothetical protein